MADQARVVPLGFNRREPASVEDAHRERGECVAQIQELQAWVSGIATDGRGVAVSSQTYQRQRADVIRRLTQLQHRAGFLRKWIHAKTGGQDSTHPNKVLLARCYAALLPYEPEDSQLLREIEAQVPAPVLEAAIGGSDE